jgi:hypothetical protein
MGRRLGAAAIAAALALTLALVACRTVPQAASLIGQGEQKELRERTTPAEQQHRSQLRLLVLALDGVDRDLLYRMLRAGELPGLAALLGGQRGRRFPHAHFADRVLSVMPSNTAPGWAAVFTAAPPAVNGIPGNEFFLRGERRLAAPVPVSFQDMAPILAIYTDSAADDLLLVPTIYQRMRQAEPAIRIWVSMSQFHRGADRLLLAKRAVVADAARVWLERLAGADDPHELYEELDQEVMDTVSDALDEGPVPDVLTVYLAGTDLYGHAAPQGPDPARRAFLRRVVDPELEGLRRKLARRGALGGAHVAVVSDHGMTDVLSSQRQALGVDGPDEPPAVLEGAGFRLRPFELEVAGDHDFQAVLAYGGATAFLYLADRSRCPRTGQVCDFLRPARYREDVLAAAEAFLRASRDGAVAPGMRGALELILVRRPRRAGAVPRPFQVYLGGGAVQPVEAYLAAHPELRYLDAGRRLRELAVGPAGDRAGDVLLIAKSASAASPAGRYYFSGTNFAWHGSPSAKDSRVPFILAHPGRPASALRRTAERALGRRPGLPQVGELLIELARRPAS